AGDDPGLEHPATDTAVAGRHRPQAQPAPQRVDRILRALRAFGTVSDAQVRQSDASQMGDAEVPALQGTQNPRRHFLQRLARDKMSLFFRWRIGMTGTFA